jgi:hypothetical protein
MTGVFLKELRENLKWAGVVTGALIIFFLHEIRDAEPAFLFQFAHHYTIFIAPLAGLLMGIVQTLFDTRPDNWAFTVHRPLPRLHVFIAKCAAGLLLVYLSLAIPTAIASMWAARTGNLPIPYQFRMSLPMIADDLGAGGFYFVGMLLALRRARWYGSRLLPLGIVVMIAALCTMFIAHFWQTVVILLIVQVIAAIAAWGSFSTHGECDGPPITRFALGALIWPGAFLVGMVAFTMTDAFDSAQEWRYYQIDKTGRPVLVVQRIDHNQRSFFIGDVNGQALPEYKNIDLDDPEFASLLLRQTGTMGDSRLLKWPINVTYGGDWYRSIDPGVVRLGAVAPPGTRLRFLAMYNVPERIIQLYDPVTCTQIGTVTPDGFSGPNDPPRGTFPDHILNLAMQQRSHVMAFESIVYRIELDQRRVRPIFTASADDPIISASEFGPDTKPMIVVATARQMHVFDTSGQALFSAPLPFDAMTQFGTASVVPSNRHLIVDIGMLPGTGEWNRKVLEYSTDGTIVKSTPLAKLPEFRGPKLHDTIAFGAFFPIALRPIVPSWILDEVLDIRSEAFAGAFEGFMIGSAIVCGVATIFLARRCAFGTPKLIGWTVANLLLGPAGVITMLSVNEWPARETCAACGALRPCAQRDCPECRTPLAPAALDGREIFEPADAFQPAM